MLKYSAILLAMIIVTATAKSEVSTRPATITNMSEPVQAIGLGFSLAHLSDIRKLIHTDPQFSTMTVPNVTSGVFILQVVANGPLENAGMRPGDVWMRIGNTMVKDESTITKWASEAKIGKTYSLVCLRENNGAWRPVTLSLVGQPKTPLPTLATLDAGAGDKIDITYDKFKDTTGILADMKVEPHKDIPFHIRDTTIVFAGSYDGDKPPKSAPDFITGGTLYTSNRVNSLNNDYEAIFLIDGKRTKLPATINDQDVLRAETIFHQVTWRMPVATLRQIATAQKVEIQIVDVETELSADNLKTIRAFIRTLASPNP